MSSADMNWTLYVPGTLLVSRSPPQILKEFYREDAAILLIVCM